MSDRRVGTASRQDYKFWHGPRCPTSRQSAAEAGATPDLTFLFPAPFTAGEVEIAAASLLTEEADGDDGPPGLLSQPNWVRQAVRVRPKIAHFINPSYPVQFKGN